MKTTEGLTLAESGFYVEVAEIENPKNIVKRLGPMFERKANKVEAGIIRNLNDDVYFARVVRSSGDVVCSERKTTFSARDLNW